MKRPRGFYLTIAAVLVLLYLILACHYRHRVTVQVHAHTDDGTRLPATWRWAGTKRTLRIAVSNTLSSETTTQASARTSGGSEVYSNPVHTVIRHSARNVCLHVEMQGWRLVQDRSLRCSEHGDATVILLGDMKPSEQRTLKVRIEHARP